MIKNNLKNLRKKQGLTQKKIAEKLYIGEAGYSYWEHGATRPSIEMIFELEKILKCDFHDMFYEE